MLKLLDVALHEDPEDLYRLQGALLADDMGLGKTYMTLVAVGEYLQRQRSQGKAEKPILVVAPLSLLENWEDEVAKTYNSVPFRDLVVLQAGRHLKDFRIQGAERESVQLASFGDEDDMLDKAWGLEPDSRLSCQARVTDEDLVIEIPRYTINHAREH